MADRPDIITAKLDRVIEMIADQQEIKATQKADRPGSASLKEVRDCGGKCVRSVHEGNFASVAAVQNQTELPSERLAGSNNE